MRGYLYILCFPRLRLFWMEHPRGAHMVATWWGAKACCLTVSSFSPPLLTDGEKAYLLFVSISFLFIIANTEGNEGSK